MFSIPEGMEELEYLDESFEDDDDFSGEEDDEVDDSPASPTTPKKNQPPKGKKPKKKKKAPAPKRKPKGDPNKGNGKIGTPKTLVIVSQRVITRPDGSQVVDVVVDVDKIANADKYEFRVTNKRTGKTTVIGG